MNRHAPTEHRILDLGDSASPRRGPESPEADSLECLMSDVEGFLGEWTDRCRTMLAFAGELRAREQDLAVREDALAEWTAQAEAQQRLWESQREAEHHALQQQIEELTEAWLRLEQEQKGIAPDLDANAARTPSRAPAEEPALQTAAPAPVTNIAPPVPIGPQPSPIASPSPAPTISRHFMVPPPAAGEAGRPQTISQRNAAAPTATYTSPQTTDHRRATIRVQFEQLQKELGFNERPTR